jgi:LacI family transcriptional regulator
MCRSSTTSTDVAREAGVSQSTVSLVLNGKASAIGISEETRKRVLAAASELGYWPDPSAQALRRGRSNILGFIPRTGRALSLEQPVPFLLQAHCVRAATRRGFHVVEIEGDPTGNELIQLLKRHHVDGVLFHTPQTATEVQQVVNHGWPVVQLMVPRPDAHTAAVYVDSRNGIHAAIDHLVALGHRQIAYVGFETPHLIQRHRQEHFDQALSANQIGLSSEYQRIAREGSVISDAQNLTYELLALVERPTAIFAASDQLALGVMRALYEADIRVPDAISVVSFDDLFAPYLSPPLTSVAQPLQEVAERAIELLIDGIESDVATTDLAPVQVALPAPLVVRSSTGPILPRDSGRVDEKGD